MPLPIDTGGISGAKEGEGTWRKRQLRHRESPMSSSRTEVEISSGRIRDGSGEGRGARALIEALSTVLNMLRFNPRNAASFQRFKLGKDAFWIRIPGSQSWQQCEAWIPARREQSHCRSDREARRDT